MKPIPTIQEIVTSISKDLKNKLNLQDTELKTVLDAFCLVLAGQIKLLYLYQADVQKNLFPDTADLAVDGGELNRFGNIYLNRQPLPATNGYYYAKVTGYPGATVRAGLTFKSTDLSKNPGFMFITDSEYNLIGDNTDTILIRSLETGLDSELAILDELMLTEPVIGVDETVYVSEIQKLPVSAESDEAYRLAIVNAIQLEPQGGSKTDYRLWASDAEGVRMVYPYVKESGAGVIQVYVEATEENSIDNRGVPTETILNRVEEVINFDPDISKDEYQRGRRPIQSILEVLPVEIRNIDVNIKNLHISSQEIKDNIRQNLFLYLKTIRPFVDGADLLRNKNDILNSARLQGVASDSIDGTNYFEDFEMFVDGVSNFAFTFERQFIPFLRNINYV